MLRITIALALAIGRDASADPAGVEWTFWIGSSGGIAKQPEEDHEIVYGFRAGAAVDFELAQLGNPFRFGGGKLELRWGPWLLAEGRTDSQYIQGGLALDLGQTRHAQFGTYTLRIGGGIDVDAKPIASLTFLGGVRYVPDRRHDNPKVAFASGGRAFGMLTKDGGGGTALIIGIEFEPTWVLPPYSLRKLAGMTDY